MKRSRPNRRKNPRQPLFQLPPLPRPPRLDIDWGRWLAVVASLAIVAAAVPLAFDMLELPVRRIEIEGSFQRVSKLEIATASGALGESIISLDLNAVRERISDLSWVDEVRLRRVWPDTLKVSFTEHLAAARWGESGLLNTRGELFAEDDRQEYRELPRLDGPDGSHRRVAIRYLEIRDRLTAAGFLLDELRMDPRGAFSIQLVGGMSVRIGREDIDARIDRFFDVAVPALSGDLGRVNYVDMRYPNGFAVGWRPSDSSGAQFARLDTHG